MIKYKKFLVVFGEYDYVPYYRTEQPEYNIRDCVELEAIDVKSAKVIGLRILRDEQRNDLQGWLACCECPFTGIEIEEVDKFSWEREEEYA